MEILNSIKNWVVNQHEWLVDWLVGLNPLLSDRWISFVEGVLVVLLLMWIF